MWKLRMGIGFLNSLGRCCTQPGRAGQMWTTKEKFAPCPASAWAASKLARFAPCEKPRTPSIGRCLCSCSCRNSRASSRSSYCRSTECLTWRSLCFSRYAARSSVSGYFIIMSPQNFSDSLSALSSLTHRAKSKKSMPLKKRSCAARMGLSSSAFSGPSTKTSSAWPLSKGCMRLSCFFMTAPLEHVPWRHRTRTGREESAAMQGVSTGERRRRRSAEGGRLHAASAVRGAPRHPAPAGQPLQC
mmetsp:Transcript_70770/g.188127  ORF Transcript_70770/g.188127 Transcript_70770/m.188127 type:complete len:244 (-) Transcript_70770:13-744(-)